MKLVKGPIDEFHDGPLFIEPAWLEHVITVFLLAALCGLGIVLPVLTVWRLIA